MFFCEFSTIRADHHCVGKNTLNTKKELFGLIDSVIHQHTELLSQIVTLMHAHSFSEIDFK